MSDNGQGEIRKKCPFMDGKWCIGEECAIRVELQRNGIKFTECPIRAMVVMLGEINMKIEPPQVKGLQLPDLRR